MAPRSIVSDAPAFRAGDTTPPADAIRSSPTETSCGTSKKAAEIGIAAYGEEQRRKSALLDRLLAEYNDGRKKTLLCLAVNLLETEDIEAALKTCDSSLDTAPVKERAANMASELKRIAAQRGIELKLRK